MIKEQHRSCRHSFMPQFNCGMNKYNCGMNERNCGMKPFK